MGPSHEKCSIFGRRRAQVVDLAAIHSLGSGRIWSAFRFMVPPYGVFLVLWEKSKPTMAAATASILLELEWMIGLSTQVGAEKHWANQVPLLIASG